MDLHKPKYIDINNNSKNIKNVPSDCKFPNTLSAFSKTVTPFVGATVAQSCVTVTSKTANSLAFYVC